MDALSKVFACSESELTRSCSRTAYKKSSCLHTWAIEDFSLHRDETKHGNFIESQRFGPAGRGESRWSLKLYFWAEGEEGKPSATFCLVCHSCPYSVVRARVQSWIVDAKGAKTKATLPCVRDFEGSGDSSACKLGGIALSEESSDELLSADTLIVCVQMTVIKSISSEVSIACEPALEPYLESAFGRFFKSERFVDVALVAGGKTFHAHKIILSARSSVFDAMFRNTMTEGSENRVEIEDLSAEVVEDMLTFMYTDNAPNMDVLAQDLLRAADKYDLKRLKALCAGQLLSNITVETAVDVFALADLHDSAHLKARAVDFIAEHASDVLKTDGWKRMVRERPAVMEAVCCVLFEQWTSSQ